MDFCKVEREGRLLIVTMNRPDRLNALIPESHDEMAAIFNEFQADDTLDVAILTGAGRGFCSGSDISAYVAGTNRPLPPEGGGGVTHNHGLTKPVIAAVNGVAMGGGFEIALACDLLIASEEAAFALPEPLVGAAALGGGIFQLCRKLPYAIAMNLLLTGDRLSAADAHRHGLVNQVVPAGEALNAAKAVAAKIMRCAPVALRATKQMAALALRAAPPEEAEREEAAARTRVMASEDFREGMAAFMERRKPVWRGR
ncbi:enoyl-CoA hydratase [Acidocella aquatica]|uniref:Enoyl-CoA hydratase n=1 Tax=Acidocella aquatica TaxID=1922313 RepID=A0ABQ6A0Q6_9PROT|nr:enoyl-CoA hydratase-related protein [Acidocella aquatica]GLR66025.1 enoyl-CoA hydratase [Acidocella aquatica]